MQILVVIPIKPYEAWVAMCDPKRPEYLWLKNGIITRSGNGRREVQIPCDAKRAKQIMEYAARACPEVAPFIKRITNPQI